MNIINYVLGKPSTNIQGTKVVFTVEQLEYLHSIFSEVPKDNTHESMLVKQGERNVIRFIGLNPFEVREVLQDKWMCLC